MQPVCFFDMDGLLLDTERVLLGLASDLLTPQGYDFIKTERFFLTLIGWSKADTHARLTEFLGAADRATTFYDQWYAALRQRMSQDVPLRPTVRETLEDLRARDVRMAVVTSTQQDLAEEHLHVAGVRPFFEHVVAGDMVTANKPDPAPYVEAAGRMGVRPHICYAFEDSDAGITSAMAAGCQAVQIPDLRDGRMPLPSLGQLIAPDLRTAVEALGLLPK